MLKVLLQNSDGAVLKIKKVRNMSKKIEISMKPIV